MKLWSRRAATVFPLEETLAREIVPLLEQAKRDIYADGLTDGCELALQVLLGEVEDRFPGAVVCPQPLPADVEQWARAALARIAAERRETV